MLILGVRIDFEATQAAAQKAAAAAQVAQANAAEAAAKAAVGLEKSPSGAGGDIGGGSAHAAALTADLYDAYHNGYHY